MAHSPTGFDKPRPASAIRRIRVGDLPRAMREDAFVMHAMYTDPDASERAFFQKMVPVRTVDLTRFDRNHLCKMSDEERAGYRQAMIDEPVLEYLMISQGKLLDGWHRISTSIFDGKTKMLAVDFTGLVDTAQTGFVSEVVLIDSLQQSVSVPSL